MLLLVLMVVVLAGGEGQTRGQTIVAVDSSKQ